MEDHIQSTMDSGEIKINLLENSDLYAEDASMPEKPHSRKHKTRFSVKLARVLVGIGVFILVLYFLPGLLANLNLSGSEVDRLSDASKTASTRTLPAFDRTLPKNNRLIIPSIGVDTDIGESTYDNYESALKNGVWRVSDFGQPDKIGAPVILAAHRFGYLAWTNSYRHYNSFYNLPKVKVGDTVKIDWQQREYIYGVYKTETGTAISDYSADLILYTCESLSGPERIFVYAKIL